ncbi:hypothetical protein COY16_01985 [Candidatus Roizmanbacteria bacterium CG_4_10_14_0_2_um_filter_39_13]|uniref:Type II secretion system protein GspG C-terminal domain-containing protein n=1 Tax=Candidatus Roizmanbacteria bacterium CG_4_10_14_0_2_um_filter_39_13 TaxID=1974825 RepID=A0A2M7U063_9BACT|nr:MAG: hypothetical protein COY16_01985 [Candidatus Roizmanbacteria bacterium CG_4_10_14_0_2_um_filter_39_13]
MKSGFTLVELIVVISIIGMLATLGIASYQNVVKEARNTKTAADIEEMVKAIMIHNARTGSWVDGMDDSYGNIFTTATWNNSAQGLVPEYLDRVPNDPWDRSYFYDGTPNTECGLGANSVCSAGPDGVFESHNRADETAQDDDICVYIKSDC